MNKMYEMIIDCGDQVIKVNRLGKSAADVKKRYSGNGEYIKVTDVTEDYPIDAHKVMRALAAAGFGEVEQEAVRHLLLTGYTNVIDQ